MVHHLTDQGTGCDVTEEITRSHDFGSALRYQQSIIGWLKAFPQRCAVKPGPRRRLAQILVKYIYLVQIKSLKWKVGEQNFRIRNAAVTLARRSQLSLYTSAGIKQHQRSCVKIMRVCTLSLSPQTTVTALNLIMAVLSFCVPHKKPRFKVKLPSIGRSAATL